jgi:ABC-type transport system substrate-binding protein
MVYASLAEAVANYLTPVGIRLKVTPMERAAILLANQEKKLRGLNIGGSAAFGNSATRIEAYVAGGGLYVYEAMRTWMGSSRSRRRRRTRSGGRSSCTRSSS